MECNRIIVVLLLLCSRAVAVDPQSEDCPAAETETKGDALLQTAAMTAKVAPHETELAEVEEDEEVDEWLGDMCAHPSWDFCKVCRNADGTANNNGECKDPLYWDFGNDTSKPVHTGCTPEEASGCLGKPASGVGIHESSPPGAKKCGPPDGENYSKAFYSYSWVPDGETQACVPVCANRVHHQVFNKVMCGGLDMWKYLQGLMNGNASCHKPARSCDYNDHTRKAFYSNVGMGGKCNPSFDTSVFDTCATDPTNSDNCKVTVKDKEWNVLSTCWDDAWDKVCNGDWHKQPGNCFMLADQQDANKTCIANCNTYGIPVTGCDDVFTQNGCPSSHAQSSGSGGKGRGGKRR